MHLSVMSNHVSGTVILFIVMSWQDTSTVRPHDSSRIFQDTCNEQDLAPESSRQNNAYVRCPKSVLNARLNRGFRKSSKFLSTGHLLYHHE